MNVYVFHDGRYFVDEFNRVWTKCNADNAFWARYLQCFTNVFIVARGKKIKSEQLNSEFKRADDGKSIFLVDLPYFEGPIQYLKQYFRVKKRINFIVYEVVQGAACIVRSPLSFFITSKVSCVVYGVEVVGDPAEVFSKKGGVFSKLAAAIYAQIQRQLVKGAAAVSYVTESQLQKVYPASDNAYSTYYSSIELVGENYKYFPKHELVKRYKRMTKEKCCSILGVGSLEFDYKGVDILINAVARLIKDGYSVNVTWIGSGKLITKYEELVSKSGISSSFKFAGQIEKHKVFEAYRNNDLFVMPSRTEGLPRAMIEAMSNSILCIGANVGGMSELLTEDFLFEANSISVLEEKIRMIIDSPNISYLVRNVARNFEKSGLYSQERLNERRIGFYKELTK